MFDFPVKYFEDNLIFNNTNKECWAIYKMVGFNYDYKSDQNKISILNSLARFIANIGVEGKILIVPISQDIDTHYKNIISRMNKKNLLYLSAEAHAKGTSVYLKDKIGKKGSSNDYVVYVLTKLKCSDSIIKDIKDGFEYFIKSPIRFISEFFSVETKDILKREIDSFKSLSDSYMKEQSKRISIKKASSMDCQWLYKRMYRRGLRDVKLKQNLSDGEEVPWSPFSERVLKNSETAIRPYTKDILALNEGLLDHKSNKKCISIEHGDGQTSWQTFLAVNHIPDGIEFPGSEWLLILQDYPIQTEVCIHIDTVEHKQSIR